MAMSNYAAPFMYGVVRASFVRVPHLSMFHRSFVLMGLHLGLHVPHFRNTRCNYSFLYSLRPATQATSL